MITDNFAPRNRTSCLHAPPSKLIRFQPGFNPHPEVGWVNRIRAFTRIRFRLIRILNRFKRPVENGALVTTTYLDTHQVHSTSCFDFALVLLQVHHLGYKLGIPLWAIGANYLWACTL